MTLPFYSLGAIIDQYLPKASELLSSSGCKAALQLPVKKKEQL